jgi:hypothetical protein
LKAEHAQADAKVTEAMRLVEEAELEKARITQLEQWLAWHKEGASGRLPAWSSTAPSTPRDKLQMGSGHIADDGSILDADNERIGILRGLGAGEVIEVG